MVYSSVCVMFLCMLSIFECVCEFCVFHMYSLVFVEFKCFYKRLWMCSLEF